MIEYRVQITGISGVDPIVSRARFGRSKLPTGAAGPINPDPMQRREAAFDSEFA
jgi:hypothetical protein